VSTVIVLINVAPGLRGHLTRWMSEVAAGVYVSLPAPGSESGSGRCWRIGSNDQNLWTGLGGVT